MSFKSAEFEFKFDEVIELFRKFNQVNCRHVLSVSNPKGSECFWVMRTEDSKKKGNHSSKRWGNKK